MNRGELRPKTLPASAGFLHFTLNKRMEDKRTLILAMSNKQPKDNIGVGKGRGRPKGALNQTTRSVKEAIEYAAQGLGGADRLVSWAKEDAANERVFWGNIYPKLLPLQVTGEGGGAVILQMMGADTRL